MSGQGSCPALELWPVAVSQLLQELQLQDAGEWDRGAGQEERGLQQRGDAATPPPSPWGLPERVTWHQVSTSLEIQSCAGFIFAEIFGFSSYALFLIWFLKKRDNEWWWITHWGELERESCLRNWFLLCNNFQRLHLRHRNPLYSFHSSVKMSKHFPSLQLLIATLTLRPSPWYSPGLK